MEGEEVPVILCGFRKKCVRDAPNLQELLIIHGEASVGNFLDRNKRNTVRREIRLPVFPIFPENCVGQVFVYGWIAFQNRQKRHPLKISAEDFYLVP